MPPRKFDRYMVQIGMGTNAKLAHLTDSEVRAHVLGVLSIAAAAPFRGRLLVGELPATARQVALTAGVTERVAKSALAKLQEVGILYEDSELGCLRVHDWESINPEPRMDATAAERQRRYRARGRRRPISSATKNEVMDRDEGRCVKCGSDASLEFHHRVPVADGGGNEPENLELRCVACHRHGHAVTVLSRRNARDGYGDAA